MPALRSILPILIFAALYAAIALLVTNAYYQLMMTLVLVWASFGLSWNLFSGYTGLISFGHAVFFGLGAYTTALGQIYFDLSPADSHSHRGVHRRTGGTSDRLSRRSGCVATTSRWRCWPTRSPFSTCSCGSAIRNSRYR